LLLNFLPEKTSCSQFLEKTRGTTDLSALRTDMHSHLLPGIDDGSPDAETSLRLMSGLQGLGYSRLITTPHIMWDMYRNDADTIGNAKSQLASTPVPIHAAAEYFLDDHFDQLLESDTPLLTIKTTGCW
jgi:Capsular polysaccharide biosynthesis protein